MRKYILNIFLLLPVASVVLVAAQPEPHSHYSNFCLLSVSICYKLVSGQYVRKKEISEEKSDIYGSVFIHSTRNNVKKVYAM